MRAYRSWASARCGCRSSPFIATRMAASSWPLRRNASPSRRNTRLCGSCASCAESARMSSAMAEHPGGLARALHVRPLRLFLGAAREALPVVPAGDRFRESTNRYERKAQLAMRRGEVGIEPQRAPQLLGGGGGVPLREVNASEQEVNGRVVGLHAARLLGCGASGIEILGLERPFRLRDHLGRVTRGTGAATLCRPGIHEHDHARTLETEQRLGHLRSEEHTSELQSHSDLVCRLLLEK